MYNTVVDPGLQMGGGGGWGWGSGHPDPGIRRGPDPPKNYFGPSGLILV